MSVRFRRYVMGTCSCTKDSCDGKPLFLQLLMHSGSANTNESHVLTSKALYIIYCSLILPYPCYCVDVNL